MSLLLWDCEVNLYKANICTDHAYPVAHGLRGQVGAEAGPHAAGAAVRARDLAPDGAQLGLLAARAARDGSALLGAVHVHAALAGVELGVVAAAGAFNLQITKPLIILFSTLNLSEVMFNT